MKVLEVLLDRYDSHDRLHAHRKRMVSNANAFVDVIDQEVFRVSMDEAAVAHRAAMACLTSYSFLGRDAIDRHIQRYHVSFQIQLVRPRITMPVFL